MSKTKHMKTGGPTPRRSLKDVIWGETVRDRRNNIRITVWTFLWLACLATATFVLKATGLEGPLAWALVAVPVLLSFAALAAYLRFLRQTDELTRQIQFEAIAIGFATGFILHFVMFPLAELGVPQLGRNGLMTVMVLAYLAGMGIASRRYG